MYPNLRSPKAVRSSLEAAGFKCVRNGAGYQLDGLSATCDAGWLTLHAGVDKKSDLLWNCLGRPGLWKPVADVNAKRIRRQEFHLPLDAVADSEIPAYDDEEPVDSLQACVQWAAAAAGGQLPDGWTSPERETTESWIPQNGLVLQSGSLLRQGALVCAPNRLAICFPIVNGLPESITESRRFWLDKVLAAASNRWRMVRIGFEGSVDRPTVKAEVDLSGAPCAVVEGLFKAALDALRCVVSWVVWPVVFLADEHVACRAWEAPIAGKARRKE